MSAREVTPIRPSAPGEIAFDDLYDRMQERLDELRCTLATLEAATNSDEWHDLPAAVNVLRRTYAALDRLHDEFARWHIKEPRP